MIDFNKIHPVFKNYSFKYAAIVNIDEIEKKQEPKHCIKTKSKDKGSRWVFLGNDDGSREYKSEAQAQKEVKKGKRKKDWD